MTFAERQNKNPTRSKHRAFISALSLPELIRGPTLTGYSLSALSLSADYSTPPFALPSFHERSSPRWRFIKADSPIENPRSVIELVSLPVSSLFVRNTIGVRAHAQDKHSHQHTRLISFEWQ